MVVSIIIYDPFIKSESGLTENLDSSWPIQFFLQSDVHQWNEFLQPFMIEWFIEFVPEIRLKLNYYSGRM